MVASPCGHLLLVFLPPRGQFVILQHRQGRALVLAIGLPRAGLDTLSKVGVRCVTFVLLWWIFVFVL